MTKNLVVALLLAIAALALMWEVAPILAVFALPSGGVPILMP